MFTDEEIKQFLKLAAILGIGKYALDEAKWERKQEREEEY